MAVDSPLRGLAQVNIAADDVAAARDWYAEFLGVPAYFERPDHDSPAYVEFRLGDYEHELGIIDRRFLPPSAGTGGVIARWHVDDLQAVVARLLGLGARQYEPITERGEGFVTASVVDPFGNILGLISSPHYREQLGLAGR